ncbi:uncharacterized protein LOC135830947 [Sycon ciliatum]|uniref:uncharacterized protein LOC135830947 n=1 Tax=Sycon ciliatum TaxID=27933 RepID=UPI0031F5F6BE
MAAAPSQGEAIQLHFPSTHRSDLMIEDQVSKVQDAQSSLLEAMISLQEAKDEEDRESYMNQVQALHKRCNEMLVRLQVMIKVRTELGFSKLELEEARKTGTNVRACQKRVSWLEERLDKLLVARQHRGRQKTRRLRHLGGVKHIDPSYLHDQSRTRTVDSEHTRPKATESVDNVADHSDAGNGRQVHGGDTVIHAPHASVALRKAASLLSDLKHSRHLGESSISTLDSSVATDVDTADYGRSEDDGKHQMSSEDDDDSDDDDFSFGDAEDEFDDDDDDEEEEDSEFESSEDDTDKDSSGSDELYTSGTQTTVSGSQTETETSLAPSSSSSESSRAASTELLGVISTPKIGAAKADAERADATPHVAAHTLEEHKRSVTFMTEPPVVHSGSVPSSTARQDSARSILKKPGALGSARSGKELTLPPIGQFATVNLSPTPTRNEIMRELKKRIAKRQKQHAGCAQKPFRTSMQFGPVESMGDPFTWQTIGLALPGSLVEPAYKRDQITTPPPDHTEQHRDLETTRLQTMKFNAFLAKIQEVDTQMQYAGQYSADSKLPPLTLQSIQMSHSNKIALAKSCGMMKPGETIARSPVPTPVPEETNLSPAPSSRTAGSRASDAISVLDGLEESRSNSPEDADDGRGAPDVKYTILHRNAPSYPTIASKFLRGKQPPRPAVSLASQRAHQATRNVKTFVPVAPSSEDNAPRTESPLLLSSDRHTVNRRWQSDDEFGCKARRLKTLIAGKGWLNSNNAAVRQSAAKEIGELGCHDRYIVKALLKKVADPHFIVRYQASRSLILLGEWHDSAGAVVAQFLEHGSDEAKLDILDILIRSHHGTQVLSSTGVADSLDNVLKSTCADKQCITAISFRAAYCLALIHKDMSSSHVVDFLHSAVNNAEDEGDQIQALDSLYKDVKVHPMKLLDSYMKFLFSATAAKHRLLCVIRIECVAKDQPRQVAEHPRLEQQLYEKLWNDSNKEVSVGAARVLKLLNKQQQACREVQKQLESEKETLRIKGVRSMCALRMRARGNIQILVDLVRMDPCQSVQLAAVRAFADLNITDSTVLRLLQSKASGPDTALKQEALHTLQQLKVA